MTIIEKLYTILEYYRMTRGVGHSKLLNDGLANYNKDKFVLCSDVHMGDRMKIRRSEILSLKGLRHETFRGHNRPMVIDNSAMMILLEESLRTIGDLSDKVTELRNGGECDDDTIMELRKELEAKKRREIILKSLLKHSIEKVSQQETKIIEMEKRPFKTFFKSVYGNISKSAPRRSRRNEGRGIKSGSNKVVRTKGTRSSRS